MELDTLIKYLEVLSFLVIIVYGSIHVVISAIDLKNKYPTESKKIIDALWTYIPLVVNYLEQMRKNGDVDTLSLRALGEEKLQELLKANGINIDLTKWEKYIEVLVESAVNKLPKFQIDSSK